MTRFPSTVLSLSLLVGGTTAIAAAQQPAAKPPAKGSTLVVLVGCVSANPNQPGGFMLSEDPLNSYKLTGSSMRDYTGKRVQVYGEPPKRLKVVGGLYPSPNAAAQAGQDPVKDAIAAATPANTPGGSALPEFKVKSVQVVEGECPGR